MVSHLREVVGGEEIISKYMEKLSKIKKFVRLLILRVEI